MRYTYNPPKNKTRRPPSKLGEQLERDYIRRTGLEKKPTNDPAFVAALQELLEAEKP